MNLSDLIVFIPLVGIFKSPLDSLREGVDRLERFREPFREATPEPFRRFQQIPGVRKCPDGSYRFLTEACPGPDVPAPQSGSRFINLQSGQDPTKQYTVRCTATIRFFQGSTCFANTNFSEVTLGPMQGPVTVVVLQTGLNGACDKPEGRVVMSNEAGASAFTDFVTGNAFADFDTITIFPAIPTDGSMEGVDDPDIPIGTPVSDNQPAPAPDPDGSGTPGGGSTGGAGATDNSFDECCEQLKRDIANVYAQALLASAANAAGFGAVLAAIGALAAADVFTDFASDTFQDTVREITDEIRDEVEDGLEKLVDNILNPDDEEQPESEPEVETEEVQIVYAECAIDRNGQPVGDGGSLTQYRAQVVRGAIPGDVQDALIRSAQFALRGCEPRIEPAVATPEQFHIRAGSDVPQLAVLFRRRLSNGNWADGPFRIAIPHYRGGVPSPSSFTTWQHGSIQGSLTLADNSRIICYASSENEARRVIGLMSRFVDRAFIVPDEQVRIAEISRAFTTTTVQFYKASLYSRGVRNVNPEWSLYFDGRLVEGGAPVPAPLA